VFFKPSEQHNFYFLFAGLVLFMTVLPLVSDLSLVADTLVSELSLTLVLLIGVWTLEGNRWVFRAGLLLAALTLAATLSYFAWPSAQISHVVELLSLLFMLLSAVMAFRAVFLAGDVNLNRLAGAASLYLLIALIWALLYSILHRAHPHSISGLPEHATLWDCLYFSATTLTTLGYGDVLPLSRAARTLASVEVVLGQFYLTILVAALVGMHVAGRRSS
jgi:hypothetical protein